ncbi:hypothetical protein AMAG_19820 [Allomyces macrogynus ATCC 38327]|uniref:Uncharacterized protein n=1 Tax=Allomyces macrogynus (strain ATCC 38327) TaxID=578462 RepID=A0A0L0SZP5_ALLM3|nr:hypothetical protein AMAG_19820 [Allomyces macrogynus ATCC 38327]|eukprot:KNE67962.1 hypothetical protein AMAG_19820 [Allomyces macrogynus ATCC 38327]
MLSAGRGPLSDSGNTAPRECECANASCWRGCRARRAVQRVGSAGEVAMTAKENGRDVADTTIPPPPPSVCLRSRLHGWMLHDPTSSRSRPTRPAMRYAMGYHAPMLTKLRVSASETSTAPSRRVASHARTTAARGQADRLGGAHAHAHAHDATSSPCATPRGGEDAT